MGAIAPGAPAGSVAPGDGERLFPLLSAGLLVLSFPPFHLVVVPFVALVPFALFLDGLQAGPRGEAEALRGGLLLGLAYFGLLLHWIPWALARLSPVAAVPAYLAVVAALAGITAGVAWTTHRLRCRLGVPTWLGLAVAWTAGEWLRAHLPGGLAFPWLGLGTSLTGVPEVAGVAEAVGARGVTFWLALSAGVAARFVDRRREGRGARGVLAALAVLVLVPSAWGLLRARTLDLRPALRAAVLQPALSRALKGDPERAVARTLEAARRFGDSIGAGGPDLVVWPETTLPVALDSPGASAVRASVEAWAERVGAPLLVGAYGSAPDADGARHNSAFLVRPGAGADAAPFRYDKRRLVPVVEAGGVGRAGGLEPGGPGSLGRIGDGVRFGVLVCYESAFPGLSRAYRREGADVLVNLTNDDWFGGEPWFARTGGLWQHPAHLVMRAIENRIGVVRAANTGFSFFVDPVGRIHDRLPSFAPAAEVATVTTTDLRTLYTRLGDVAGSGSALLTLGLLLAAAVGRRGGES